MKCLIALFGLYCWVLHERTVMSTGFRAQVSMSRLGEINRGSPRLFHASRHSGDQRYFERANVSLRRGESRFAHKAIVPVSRALA